MLLAVTAWHDFRQSSKALEGQLQSAAQNMATTVGLAIANSGQGTDPAFVEALFNATFDSGYLASIELISPTGKMIHARQQVVSIQNAPDWFVHIVRIEAASGESQIIKNWVQYGTLRLTLHPGYAYAGLYGNLKSNLLWFGIVSLAGLLLLWIFLHLLLRPLNAIQGQADAIIENRFIQNEQLPKTRELRQVVVAMNRMVARIQTVFTEQAASLNRYHQQLYRDALTGLGNRRHLVEELEEICRNASGRHGCLAILHLSSFAELKGHMGYKEADSIVLTLARLIEETAGKQARKHSARIRDAEFAIYFQGDIETAKLLTQQIFDEFHKTAIKEGVDNITSLSAGLAPITMESTTSTVLSEADFSLTQAKASGKYIIYHETQSDLALPQGKMEWRTWLENALEQHRFFLVTQPVIDRKGNPVHREAFIRLRNEQKQLVPAGVFMPVANALNLGYIIELEVLKAS